MITIGFAGVQFSVNPGYASEEAMNDPEGEPDQVAVAFLDPQSGIQGTVIFDKGGWAAFKRHVAADGKMPTDITIAQPGDMPKMAVPKGA